MQEWLQKHMGRIISWGGSIIMFILIIISWFLNRTINQVDNKFNKQDIKFETIIKDYKADDRELKLLIDSKMNTKAFEEFRGTFNYMAGDVAYIKEHMKTK